MRAGRSSAIVLALAAILLTGARVSAHRLDEYLQAARLAVDPGRVELELDLTPGLTVAEAIVENIDRDHDGLLSHSEKTAYVSEVIGALELQVDSLTLHLQPIGFIFPGLDALRRGDGTIQLRSAVVLPRLPDGNHRLSFRNRHRPDVSAYLANALVPESDRIAITSQRRDVDQRELTIDYALGADTPASLPLWLIDGIATASGLAAFRKRSGLLRERTWAVPQSPA